MRGVGWLVFWLALFAALPVDAQYLLAGGPRFLVERGFGPYVVVGMAAALVTFGLIFNMGWNASEAARRDEGIKRAEDDYNKRKR